MRIIIAGGTGQIGQILARHFHARQHHVTVLARHLQAVPWKVELWDGETPGDWTQRLNGCDVLINLAGRSVNCRYNQTNRREIMDSRVLSTQVLGKAVAQASQPPKLWLNASTATIYRHALDRPMDEATGELGGDEPGAPSAWNFSIDVARRWEQTFFEAPAPLTRKVAMRSAMTMSPDRGGIFATLLRLVELGMGGRAARGNQFISWIHDADFIRAVEFLIENEQMSGPVNLCSPCPLPNREFMRALRQCCEMPGGLPAAKWMLEAGAFLMRTETELILKSRRVVPSRLLAAGFEFLWPEWPDAARNLVQRWNG